MKAFIINLFCALILLSAYPQDRPARNNPTGKRSLVINPYYDSLDIGNISAGVTGDGQLFSRMPGQPGTGLYYGAHFNYPKGSKTHTIYNSTLWLGALDETGQLRYTGEIYRQVGTDFQPGPVSNIYDSVFAVKYNRVWKLNRTDVEYHRNNWWKAGYVPNEVIAAWPGNGEIQWGIPNRLAPYYDYNLDGLYNPMDGDYPLIRGDQTVFIIYNDDKTHTESQGERLKVEIHAMIYGFDAPNDSVLHNTVFVHYDIINRSENIYHDAYLGIFTDFDLGYPWDDYIGSDVTRGSFYAYNGYDIDITFVDYGGDTVYGYQEYPPAQSVTILGGPFMPPDGLDNPKGGCDHSVNGFNFGNGITDDERFGLTGFLKLPPLSSFYYWFAPDCYGFLTGFHRSGTRWNYGGYGIGATWDTLSLGPACNFFFPGDSDPLNWGTDCVPPNGGYNQPGNYWTDSTVNIYPSEIKGLGIIGPMTFKPGEILELEIAFCAANGWEGRVSSIHELMEHIDTLLYRVRNGGIIIPNEYLGISSDVPEIKKLKVYPNPARDYLHVEFPGNLNTKAVFSISDILGEVISSGTITQQETGTIDISRYKPGFYIINIRFMGETFTTKFIKHK